jgi:hypothetical protein
MGTKTVTGEVGILRHVMTHSRLPNQCYLIIEYEGERYTGCLIMDDIAFLEQLCHLLEFYLGRPIQEIGDLDVSHTL